MDTKTLRPINENDKWMTGSPVLNLHEYYYRFVKATNSFPSATEDLLLMVAEDSSSENPPLLFPTQIVVLIEQVIKDYNFLHKIKIFQTPKDFLLKYESKKEGLEILQRKKEAFSDGVINIGSKPWYKTYLQNEKEYYLNLFKNYYPNNQNIIPYYWMPKWSPETTDPSARTLTNY